MEMVTVPREPTQAMIDAALKDVEWIKSEDQRKAHAKTYAHFWRVMMDAALAEQKR